MTKSELESSITMIEKLLIFFGVLVALGVTGESIFGFKLWRRNNDLKRIQEEEIAQLGERAAQANQRAAELQALIQPRELSDDQQRLTARSLRPLAGRSLLIGSHWNDVESARLAAQLKATLNSAGIGVGIGNPLDWIGKYPEIPVGLFGGGVVTGVEIHTGIEVWGADKVTVADALRRIGKLAATTPAGESPFKFEVPGLVTVFVGVKPLPEVK